MNGEIDNRFRMSRINQEIKIADVVVVPDECLDKGSTNAEVYLRFQPTLQLCLRLRMEVEGISFSRAMEPGGTIKLEFQGDRASYRFLVIRVEISDVYKITAVPIDFPLVYGPQIEARRVVFHLLNFPEFIGPDDLMVREAKKMWRKGNLHLKAGDIQINITETLDTKALYKSLKNEGGYAITHVGTVEYQNNKKMPIIECQELFLALDCFFSFVAGLFSDPILLIGFNENNEEIWQDWSPKLNTSYKSTLSWFDNHHAESLKELFPEFMKVWHMEVWQETLKSAVYWYVRSNIMEGGTDGSLILAQAALELVAYTYFVDHKKSWSHDMFLKTSASDIVRELLISLGIPIDIPQALIRLYPLGQGFQWNGPQALTEIRNYIIHPGQKRKRLANQDLPLAEAWKLALWYIELALLKICNYKGKYANRLRDDRWVGEVEAIP